MARVTRPPSAAHVLIRHDESLPKAPPAQGSIGGTTTTPGNAVRTCCTASNAEICAGRRSPKIGGDGTAVRQHFTPQPQQTTIYTHTHMLRSGAQKKTKLRTRLLIFLLSRKNKNQGLSRVIPARGSDQERFCRTCRGSSRVGSSQKVFDMSRVRLDRARIFLSMTRRAGSP